MNKRIILSCVLGALLTIGGVASNTSGQTVTDNQEDKISIVESKKEETKINETEEKQENKTNEATEEKKKTTPSDASQKESVTSTNNTASTSSSDTTQNTTKTVSQEVKKEEPKQEVKQTTPSTPQTNQDLTNQLEGNKQEEGICIAKTTGYPSEEAAYSAAIDEISSYEATHEGVTGSCGASQHYDDFGHSYWTYWVSYN